MVTMQAGWPMAIITGDRVRPSDVQIRTGGTRPRAVPVRLTRRGRIVVTVVSALLICVASMALATAAHATRSGGGAASLGRYVTKVVVRPGQSLWTVAEAYDPDADTRLVIADIEQMNSMTGDQLQPGETLWVPRG
jgi:nucleoid-associated protein YgaU